MNLRTVFQLCLIVCLSWLLMATPAHARGGCFAKGTHILTADGDRLIEQLHVGDPILGLNLESQQLANETIGDIQVVKASDYYVINDSITVTGSHPFYIQKETDLALVRAEDLVVGNQLVGESSPVVRTIHHYEKPMTVYNLISVTPHHNFYAEGILVHNKGGGGGSGGGGFHGSHGHGSIAMNEKTLPGLMISLLVFILCMLPIVLWRELYNGIRFFEKEFSESADLVSFTQQVNPQFSNQYSMSYREDDEGWESHPLLQELNTVDYREFIEKDSLVSQVSQIFSRYQNDWMRKAFDAMADYTMPSFHQQQQALFRKDFLDDFDIIYQPEVKRIVPVDAQQSDDDFVITVQLVATVINFEVSSKGKVLSGHSYPRTFTEYWDIAVDSQKICRLANIWYSLVIDR